jgi:F-type H+-transporting ATPase subunit epsilon
MSGPITLRVVTPERVVLDTTVNSVVFPGLDGSTGVLKGHAPLVSALGVGELSFRDESGQETGLFVAGGFAEVRDNTVRIVTEASEPPTDIDVHRAEEAAARHVASDGESECARRASRPDARSAVDVPGDRRRARLRAVHARR